ncbi:MAG: YraN family protein [Myxococcota bacterium]
MTPPHDRSRRKRSPRDRRSLGNEGEERAARYLARRGYRIVARNLRSGGVEVDLVVRRGGIWVFVEVKTRRSTRFGRARESLGPRQCARLVRAARTWLAGRAGPRRRVRFDLVACELHADGSWHVEHWPDAFDAGDVGGPLV